MSKISSEVRQTGRHHRKSSKTQTDGAGPEPPSQPWPPAGAKQLTSGKSGIVTWSRSRGRPLAPAALLRKLATELQVSCLATRGRNTTTGETETLQPRSKPSEKGILDHIVNVFKNPHQQNVNVNVFSHEKRWNSSCLQAPHTRQSHRWLLQNSINKQLQSWIKLHLGGFLDILVAIRGKNESSPLGWCGLNLPWRKFWSHDNYCTLKAAEKTHLTSRFYQIPEASTLVARSLKSGARKPQSDNQFEDENSQKCAMF